MTDLFSYVPPSPQFSTPDMHRKRDHQTSIDAAERVAKNNLRRELQEEIHAILKARGPMTDGELERLDCFAHYGPSTVRKRRSELYQDGRVGKTGERRDGMNVWVAQ